MRAYTINYTRIVGVHKINMKRLILKLAQCKQWLIYYVRRMLPEHKCKYCGCMTRQPDSECYAKSE